MKSQYRPQPVQSQRSLGQISNIGNIDRENRQNHSTDDTQGHSTWSKSRSQDYHARIIGQVRPGRQKPDDYSGTGISAPRSGSRSAVR